MLRGQAKMNIQKELAFNRHSAEGLAFRFGYWHISILFIFSKTKVLNSQVFSS